MKFLLAKLIQSSILTLLVLSSCATSNDLAKSQLIFASAAMKGAERAQAERKAPDLFRKAENALYKARLSYEKRNFDVAAKAANESRKLSERAERDAEILTALSDGDVE